MLLLLQLLWFAVHPVMFFFSLNLSSSLAII